MAREPARLVPASLMRRAIAIAIATGSLFVAAPAFAADDDVCKEAVKLQENRITDLTSAVAYDKRVERELLDGANARDKDADAKDEHAKKFRAAADKQKDDKKKTAFGEFAGWLESEAKTDRMFAKERKAAAAIIGKGWAQAESAIEGHKKFLAKLRERCGALGATVRIRTGDRKPATGNRKCPELRFVQGRLLPVAGPLCPSERRSARAGIPPTAT